MRCVMVGLLWVFSWSVWAQDPAGEVLVVVDGESIGVDEFVYEVRTAVRNEFYHGAIPEAELTSYRRRILDEMIESRLLAKEALRRGVEFDPVEVAAQLKSLDAKREPDPAWVDEREHWLPLFSARLEREALLGLLKQRVASELVLTAEQQLSYYLDNADKFTRPMQLGVSLILLKVDPSSGQAAWGVEIERAKTLVEALRSGSSFEEYAELYSADVTASVGGDMGLLHDGMLGQEAEKVLAELELGEISDPVVVLDGVVILRLNARVEAELLPFDAVEERLRSLLAAERAELAWQALRFKLRSQAEIRFNESHFARLGI